MSLLPARGRARDVHMFNYGLFVLEPSVTVEQMEVIGNNQNHPACRPLLWCFKNCTPTFIWRAYNYF